MDPTYRTDAHRIPAGGRSSREEKQQRVPSDIPSISPRVRPEGYRPRNPSAIVGSAPSPDQALGRAVAYCT